MINKFTFLSFVSILSIIIYNIYQLTLNILVIECVYPYLTELIKKIQNFICYLYDRLYDRLYYNSETNTLTEVNGSSGRINNVDSNINNIYNIHSKNKEHLIANNDNKYIQFLTNITCPICYNIYDNIYMCHNGHTVCSNCYQNDNTCAYCRVIILPTSRVRILEEMINNLELPCSYHMYGCKKNVLSKNRQKHENNCEFKPMKCMIENCNIVGNYDYIKNHINKNHMDKLLSPIKINNNNVKYKTHFNLNKLINYDDIRENYSMTLKTLDIVDSFAYINYTIKTSNIENNIFDDDDIGYYNLRNKLLCISVLGYNNNFDLTIYKKKCDKLGYYNIKNKLKTHMNHANTIYIPLIDLKRNNIDKFTVLLTMYYNL
tara:strand:+ start:3541 stop:4665 length:1125 start_codon:yes stop_codon:yes gene_type:complete